MLRNYRSLLVAVVGLLFVVLLSGHEYDNLKSIGASSPPGIGGNGPFDSVGVKLLAQLPLADMGGGPANVLANDCWGWTDPLNGKEYAIVGLTNATSFVDISDPTNPKYLGKLPTHTGNRTWRDVKVLGNHCYVVADSNGAHGLQIFDLTQLRTVDPANPQIFSETSHYDGFTRAHNIFINEETGFAYIVGANVASGGLRILDLNNDPLNPTVAGSFSDDGYTHDVQVVVYRGPDASYFEKEIAFASNEDTLTIVDVSDKSTPLQISRNGYSGSEYSHQGWLTPDHRYFLMNDELDELRSDDLIPTRTHIWNVVDLDAPVYEGYFDGQASTIDHNLYTRDRLVFEGNYSSGMRVLKLNDPHGSLTLGDVGYFDTYPTDDNVSFNGVWSVYPYFPSGRVIISDRQNGLFVVEMESKWVDFSESQSSFFAPPVDTAEKDMVCVDMDRDGDDDVVVVRREAGTGAALPNKIYMNEGGTLRERSANIAQDFLIPDAATDVAVIDADGDDYPDLIVTLGDGSPPRLFMNNRARKKRTRTGSRISRWGGLTEKVDWMSGEFPVPPKFQSVAVGDIDGDGNDDLYFTDADNNLEDRLLINKTGAFEDETDLRMTAAMAASSFGSKAAIVDMNNDGHNDILKLSISGNQQFLRLLVNNGTGNFDVMQNLPFNNASTFEVGDFDNDGRTDIFVVSEQQDYLLRNQSTISQGRIQVGILTVTDSYDTSGFGGNASVVDVDEDGLLDVAVADIDVQIGGADGKFRLLKGNGTASMLDPNDALDFDWNTPGVYDSVWLDLNADDRLDLLQGTTDGLRAFIFQ